MPSTRQKKRYSESQIRGMQIVSQILKNARLQHGYSFRGFATFVSERSQTKFNHSRVQTFERAGDVTDQRNGVVNTIHPDYLKAVQPLTPYTLRFLKEIYDGDIIENQIQGASTLKDMIEEKESALGATKFRWECKNLGLTEEAIIEAKHGNLTEKVAVGLSRLFQVPIDSIDLAAIAQVNADLAANQGNQG